MEYKNVCRVCLDGKKKLNSLYEAFVSKMIMECTSVIIMEGDGLPDKICVQCTLMASRAYRFKQLCEKSDMTLREYATNSKLNTDMSLMKPDLLLVDNNTLGNDQCSVYADIFMKNDAELTDPLPVLTTDASTLDVNMQIITEQCLPSLWDVKRTADYATNSTDVLNQHDFCESALQSISLNKEAKDDWNIDLKNDIEDIDSSTYSKSYIDLDHSSKLIQEDRLKRQNKTCSCEICGETFLDAKCLKKHQQIHENCVVEKRYMCSFCGKRYKENKLLMYHMRSHTGERPLKCEICEKTFSLPSSLHKHRLIHTGEKKYKCNLCDKSFYQVSNYNMHMRNHNGEKPFICSVCLKSFATKSKLDVHSRTHTGHKPFMCVICNASFGSNGQLKKHTTKHTGEKNYVCSHCGESFRHKETRDTHERYHTDERPYSCNLCPKRFVASSHLRTHKLSHLGERRFQCAVCNKLFLQKRHLTAHMSTHTGLKPYSCSICGRCFAHSGTLSTHMKGHNKVV